MTDTTYCHRHERIEHVEAVAAAQRFQVFELDPITGERTIVDRFACDVHATTTSGCKVHFIAGPDWRIDADAG